MRAKTYEVSLSVDDRQRVERIARSNKVSRRERQHARILLLADRGQDGGGRLDADIARRVRYCRTTVGRVRRRFVDGGWQAAIYHRPQVKRKARALDGTAEAHLIAWVCSQPPPGTKRWSLYLLRDKLIEARLVDSVSPETVRQTLKKTHLSLG